MSRTAELVIAAAALPTVAGGVGALVLGLGAAGYGAYQLCKKLQQDYQDGLDEFHRREDADERARRDLAQGQREETEAARERIARTGAAPGPDANALFLQHRLQQLRERVTDQEMLTTECDVLADRVAQHPERFHEHLDAFRRLADAAATANTAPSALADEITALREEIASPLLDVPAQAEVRQQFLAQLDALETVGVRQRTVARQGLSLLRQRLYRELQDQATEQQARAVQAEERRALIGRIFARLRAVSAQTELPGFPESAALLQTRLSELLASPDDNLDALRALTDEADALFASCEETLQEELVSAYVREHVQEVLLTLGYQVKPVDLDDQTEHLVAEVGDGLGIDFAMDGHGRIGAEMVALHPDAAHAGPTEQEQVCTVIDQVIARLGERTAGVRERYRTSLREDEELRVVEIEADDVAPIQQTAPRLKRMDQP